MTFHGLHVGHYIYYNRLPRQMGNTNILFFTSIFDLCKRFDHNNFVMLNKSCFASHSLVVMMKGWES
jgi:hypothetical protein